MCGCGLDDLAMSLSSGGGQFTARAVRGWTSSVRDGGAVGGRGH